MEELYIGVDLGGTKISAGIVNKSGKILHKKTILTNLPQPEKKIEEKICQLCNEICEDMKLNINKDIVSVGIGSPGNVNNKTGIVGFNANFGYKNWHIKDNIQKALGLNVEVENDANVAILAEVVAGCAKGCKDAVIITLGTGVGSGVVINSKIYNGYNQSSAEMGHMVICVDGRKCNCGRKGCFERYASATALVRDTQKAMIDNPTSLLWQVCNKIENVSPRTIFDALKLNDVVAQEVFDNYVKYLACGIINIVNIFQPEVLCIGGGVSNQEDVLLKPIQQYLDKQDYARNLADRVKLKIATFRNDAGIIGAALLGMNNDR